MWHHQTVFGFQTSAEQAITETGCCLDANAQHLPTTVSALSDNSWHGWICVDRSTKLERPSKIGSMPVIGMGTNLPSVASTEGAASNTDVQCKKRPASSLSSFLAGLRKFIVSTPPARLRLREDQCRCTLLRSGRRRSPSTIHRQPCRHCTRSVICKMRPTI